jgi:hypothetical protein
MSSYFANSVNPITFLVILTLALDRDKNRCNNGETAVPDKPDYRVFNHPPKWPEKRGQIRA